jgi:hypothetical protein
LEKLLQPQTVRVFKNLADWAATDAADCQMASPLFEIALVLVRFDDIAHFIVNANHSIV